MDEDSQNHLYDAVMLGKSKGSQLVLLAQPTFDHVEQVVIDEPPPICCRLPEFLRFASCDCTRKQSHQLRKFYRHKALFLAFEKGRRDLA